jgi:excisionase family DNA binding protein
METAENTVFLTTKEAASYLRVHWMTLSKWCKEGSMPAAKIGKNWRIKKDDLDKWFKGKVKINGKTAQ